MFNRFFGSAFDGSPIRVPDVYAYTAMPVENILEKIISPERIRVIRVIFCYNIVFNIPAV